jgi:hypothetical protein
MQKKRFSESVGSGQGTPGKYYPFLEKSVDCDALFSNADIDANAEFQHPPAKIPKYL